MFDRYSELARQAVFFARMEAGEAGASSIDTKHLLIAILTVDPELPYQLGIELDAISIRNQSQQLRPRETTMDHSIDMPVADDLATVLEHAISVADEQQCREVRTEHLVASMFEHNAHVADTLRDLGLEQKSITSLLKKIDCNKPQLATEAAQQAMFSVIGKMVSVSPSARE